MNYAQYLVFVLFASYGVMSLDAMEQGREESKTNALELKLDTERQNNNCITLITNDECKFFVPKNVAYYSRTLKATDAMEGSIIKLDLCNSGGFENILNLLATVGKKHWENQSQRRGLWKSYTIEELQDIVLQVDFLDIAVLQRDAIYYWVIKYINHNQHTYDAVFWQLKRFAQIEKIHAEIENAGIIPSTLLPLLREAIDDHLTVRENLPRDWWH